MPAEEVGVVVPAYNAEPFLAATLEGILSQTVPVAECVVVDDGSTDGTAAVARAAAGPVRVVRQENRGVSAARNRGMDEVSTSWVAFCDADDVWFSEKLERQLERLDANPDAVAALAGVARIGPDGAERERVEMQIALEEVTLCELVRHRSGRVPESVPSSLLAARGVLEAVGAWDESLGDAADWDYAIRLRKRGPLTGPPEPLVGYRRHPDAMSRHVEGRARDAQRLFRKLRRDPEIERRCGDTLAPAWGRQATVLAASYWRAGRRGAALAFLAGELARHPVAVGGALLERVRR